MGISSDGDGRSLEAMKCEGKINLNPLDKDELKLIGATDYIFLQDPTHIGTKLRNRLLKASILLPFGTKAISVGHLKALLQNAPKDVHGLVQSYVMPQDRSKLQQPRENNGKSCY